MAGHTLVGARGFSCIACHGVGSFEPRNVALGTRGSDLLALGRRMRPSYYLRWTRSPIRIVPGMEMPAIVKPVAGVLGEDLDAQLRATWQALNDPRFTVPTDPASVEQFVTVQPGERPRIIRDVFTCPKENGGGYVARALAVGFNNGHNLLFDLDTFSLRGWYFGDFARQRTLGKSWYWDMAGVPVVTGFDRGSDIALLKITEGDDSKHELIRPKMRGGTCGRLLRYVNDKDRTRENRGSYVRIEYEVEFEIDGRIRTVLVHDAFTRLDSLEVVGLQRDVMAQSIPNGYDVVVRLPDQFALEKAIGSATVRGFVETSNPESFVRLVQRDPHRKSVAYGLMLYVAKLNRPEAPLPTKPEIPEAIQSVDTVPGFDGMRLPLPQSIMPTAFAWRPDGTLAFTSLKGHVDLARDTDGDELEDDLTVFEEGLAAPYGVLADGDDLLVCHKPDVLRLRDNDHDGRADVREVVASGWGYNDNYHDWTTGLVRDEDGNLYVGTGSDYAQKDRPAENARWRGKVLRLSPAPSQGDGKKSGLYDIAPIAHGFRYPMGLAFNAAGDLFATDNQGVQNTFNEINHIVDGAHYGVPGRYESDDGVTHLPPAIQVPHPWTRSVNALFFIPEKVGGLESRVGGDVHPSTLNPQPSTARLSTLDSLAGHAIGCEYDSRFLVRMTFEKIDGVYQGAAYYFSRPNEEAGGNNFLGPICGAVAPDGDIYIGSMHDSGWLGGRNTGGIVRLKANGKLPNGIRELRIRPDGFELEFFRAVDAEAAARAENYTVSGYTRVWQGGYATPDSGRHRLDVQSATLAADSHTVQLAIDGLKTGHVYEVSCAAIGTADQRELWPSTGHYTLHRLPKPDTVRGNE
ncbi:MAG: PQQ-dependent sugar dehydrogenase [Planctomycetes bacterium]|nr:PQQ-dependent sugar dehydrogenase [Planctomycetota bacterium]